LQPTIGSVVCYLYTRRAWGRVDGVVRESVEDIVAPAIVLRAPYTTPDGRWVVDLSVFRPSGVRFFEAVPEGSGRGHWFWPETGEKT